MKTYNEIPLNLSRGISKDNVQKSYENAKKLTGPSNATHLGSLIGLTLGAAFLCFGIIGARSGKIIAGHSVLAAGVTTIVSNVINLKRSRETAFEDQR